MYFYIYFYSNNFGSTDKVHVFYQMASTQPLKVRGKEKKNGRKRNRYTTEEFGLFIPN